MRYKNINIRSSEFEDFDGTGSGEDFSLTAPPAEKKSSTNLIKMEQNENV